MKVTDFEGLLSAPVTPTLPNGDLNTSVIGQYIDHLVKDGVLGAFVNGTTGEGLSFTTEERKRVTECWVKEGRNKLKCIIIHIGGYTLHESQELARHAESLGVDAIASLPPLYYKPKTVEELVEYLKDVASAAPRTPFYYYHIPIMTNVNFPVTEILDKGKKIIPTLVGAKHSTSDLIDLARANALDGGRFHLLNGFDELLGCAMTLGTRAAVGGSYNFTGKLSNSIFRNFKQGNLDGLTRDQIKINAVMASIYKKGWGPAVLKACTELAVDFPVGPPRRPLQQLPEDAMKELGLELQRHGIPVARNKLKL